MYVSAPSISQHFCYFCTCPLLLLCRMYVVIFITTIQCTSTSPMLKLPTVQLPMLQRPCSNILSSNFPSSIFLRSSTFTAHHSTQPLSSPTSHCPLPTADYPHNCTLKPPPILKHSSNSQIHNHSAITTALPICTIIVCPYNSIPPPI